MRVLYLHPAASFGGASKSLIELFKGLSDRLDGVVLTPKGSASVAFLEAGFDVRTVPGLSQFDNTRYGHYRRLRWLILLRELFLLPFSFKGLWRLRSESFDLIHINEITLLPLGILAKKLLRVPLLVHVRSLQCEPELNWRTRFVNVLLRRYADKVVAIDCTVAATLAADLDVQIVHNGLQVEGFDKTKIDLPKEVSVIGFLGVLIPLKGIYELIEALRLLKDRQIKIHCLVAGENARELTGVKAWILAKLGFARDVKAGLEALIAHYGLAEYVTILGFVEDVRELYPKIDILCFPTHLNAAGRPVFEAAFYSIPSVVAVREPMPDAVIHEVTGLAINEPDPVLIANALQRLAEDKEFRNQLGEKAKEWAQDRFSVASNSARMCILYERLSASGKVND